MEIKSIKENVTNTLVIDKSKFITYLFKCDSLEDINNHLDELSKTYKDATHICYAYILDNNGNKTIRYIDDGEPSQSAGAPIYNVIDKNELVNILAVVIRYFGGVKLGLGGLTRAYSSSVVEALKKTNVVTYIDAYKYQVITSYELYNDIEHLIKQAGYEILKASYDENVKFDVLSLDDKQFENFISKYKHLDVKSSLIEKIKVEKK